MFRRVLRQQRENSAARSRHRPQNSGATTTRRSPCSRRAAGRTSVAAASVQGRTPSLDRMLDAADELAVGGFIADAESVLRRALELYPAYVEPKRELARLALETNDARRALHISLRAIEHHPNDLELHGMAAAAYERMGAWIRGLHHLAAVLAATRQSSGKPAHGAPPRSAGRPAGRHRLPAPDGCGDAGARPRCDDRARIALSGDGDHDEAVQLLADVARHRADSGSAQADLAMALLAAGAARRSRSPTCSEALRLDRARRRRTAAWGSRTSRLERWLEAAESFRTAEELAPDTGWAPSISVWRWPSWAAGRSAPALLRAAALAPDDGEIRAALEALPPPPAAAGACRGRAGAALHRRPQVVCASRGAGVPAAAAQDRLLGGLLPARRRHRPTGQRSGDQRFRAGSRTSGRSPGRARHHHRRPARHARWRSSVATTAPATATARGAGDLHAPAPRRSRPAEARGISAGAGCARRDALVEGGRLLVPSSG